MGFSQALSGVNTKFNERYIFAGNAYDSEAYSDTGVYVGDSDEPDTVVADGMKVKTGFAGSGLLTSGSDMFTAMTNLRNALEADDTAGIIAALDDIDASLVDLEKGMVEVGGQMRRTFDAQDLASNLEVELTAAQANIEETNVVDAYSKLMRLQTNFDAAMQVTSMQRYSGLFTRI